MTHPPRPATSSCVPVSGQDHAPAPAGAKHPASRRAGSGRAALDRNAGETHALFIPAVTRIEAEALAYLGWHIGKYKRPPGKIAMARHLDIGSHELGITIRALARKALIYRPPERPDSLELTKPIYGSAAQ